MGPLRDEEHGGEEHWLWCSEILTRISDPYQPAKRLLSSVFFIFKMVLTLGVISQSCLESLFHRLQRVSGRMSAKKPTHSDAQPLASS